MPRAQRLLDRARPSHGSNLLFRQIPVLADLQSADFDAADCTIVSTLDDARSAASAESVLMVIGGAEIYRQCLGLATRIHLTLVHTSIAGGDTFFGGWRGSDWRETSRERHEADERNDFAHSFVTLERGPDQGQEATRA